MAKRGDDKAQAIVPLDGEPGDIIETDAGRVELVERDGEVVAIPHWTSELPLEIIAEDVHRHHVPGEGGHKAHAKAGEESKERLFEWFKANSARMVAISPIEPTHHTSLPGAVGVKPTDILPGAIYDDPDSQLPGNLGRSLPIHRDTTPAAMALLSEQARAGQALPSSKPPPPQLEGKIPGPRTGVPSRVVGDMEEEDLPGGRLEPVIPRKSGPPPRRDWDQDRPKPTPRRSSPGRMYIPEEVRDPDEPEPDSDQEPIPRRRPPPPGGVPRRRHEGESRRLWREYLEGE